MKTRKSYLIIILIIICAAALAVLSIVLFSLLRGQNEEKSYTAALTAAEKYVEDGDYESAIEAYETAIELQPEEASPYLALADIYIEEGDFEEARTVLSGGYQETGSARIENMIAQIDSGVYISDLVEDGDKEESQTDGALALNTSFLQKLESFTYEDYAYTYGSSSSVESTGSGSVEVVCASLSATFFYANTDEYDDIVDEATDKPADDGMPEKVSFEDITLLFVNFSGTASFSELQSISSTTLRPTEGDGMYYVEISTGSLLIRIETDESGNLQSADAWNEVIMTEANEDRDTSGRITGVVVDATSGDGVDGAKVQFAGQSTGSAYSVQTDANGAFSAEVEADTYTITITADGYEDVSYTFEVEKDKNYSGERFAISPSLASGTVRIVLEWGQEPHDLDLYLVGETDDGDTVRVYYVNKKCTVDGDVIAELDVDDRDGEGPETITLYNLYGSYTVYVHDFSRTGTMQANGATVKIYKAGSSSPRTFDVQSASSVSLIWKVCSIDHGEITKFNSGAGSIP